MKPVNTTTISQPAGNILSDIIAPHSGRMEFRMNRKKLLSLILAGMMLVLPACNQTTPPADDSKAPDSSSVSHDTSSTETEADPDFDFGYISDNLPETLDFEGAEYNIGLPKFEGPDSSVSCDELTSEAVDVAMYNTSREIEDRFKCTIRNVETPDLLTVVRSLVATSDDYYSVFADSALALSTAFTDGIYQNLRAIPQFDFSQPWWTNGMDELSVGDRAYLGVSWLQYNHMDGAYIIFVNKEVAEKNHIEVPYEDVFNGTWTTDKLYTIASQATGELNGDGVMDGEDAWGFSYMDGFLKQWQCSMGVHFITKDENNLPVSNLDVDTASNYLTYMEKLEEFSGTVPNGTPEGFNAYFKKGNILFLAAPFDSVYELLDTDILYGFLPVPKVDEAQEEYETYNHCLAWIIPTSCAGNLEFIGTISEALNAAHFNTVRPVYFESTMKGRLSESPEDAQVLDIMSRTLYADFGFEFSQTITPIWKVRDLWADGSEEPRVFASTTASAFKKIEKNLNNYINKLFLGKFEKMIAAEDRG